MKVQKAFTDKKVISQIKDLKLIEDKHAQIFEAASTLFSKKGYHLTSLRDISSESGINLSYLYKYISSKDDILYLFYQHLQKEWLHVYEQLAEKTDEEPIKQMENFLKSMFEMTTKFKRETLTIFTESRHLNKDSLRSVLAKESHMIDCLEKLVIRGVKAGCFKTRDSFFAANVIHYLIALNVLRGWNLTDHYSNHEMIELVQDFIFSALKVS